MKNTGTTAYCIFIFILPIDIYFKIAIHSMFFSVFGIILMRQLKIGKSITPRADGAVDKYLQEIWRIEQITPQEEGDLAKRIRAGDTKALEKLVNANLRFVVSVAKQYQNQWLELPDLINEGNLWLTKAALGFDETRGFKFISYAVWWIRQYILHAIDEQAHMIRLPRNKIWTNNKASEIISIFEQKYQREPYSEEIQEILAIKDKDGFLKDRQNLKPVSLDAESLVEGSSLSDMIPNNMFPSPDDMDWPTIDNEDRFKQNFYEAIKHIIFDHYTKKLFPKDKISPLREQDIVNRIRRLASKKIEVITYYYWLNGNPEYALEAVADTFGQTKENIRRIRDKALDILKKSPEMQRWMEYL